MAIKNADEVIVECNYYKNFIASSFHDKVQTIYIAKQSNLQIVKFETVREHEISILYLGSIGHIYDFETLISLGRGLVKRNIPIKIHIIGDGEKRNWLIENLEVESIPYIYYGKIFEESNKKK
ncbi:hypothetical protein [Planococcus halocryophilus]|uniref:hypothetical protein n=1 Tax=Planococcus halocryophilus TaxID=1215089 RepID=UPI0005924D30|nr:hypothetical protein [Planococcus halocryophilus]